MSVSRYMLTAILAAALGLNAASISAGMVDPTRPPSWGAMKPHVMTRKRGLELQTTLVSPGRRIAIISGKSYSVGSRIGSARVTEIRSYEVTLVKAGKVTRLRLMPKVTSAPAEIGRAHV